MQQKLALYLGLLFYSVVVTVFLVLFDAAFVTTILILFGVPIFWFWHELYPPRDFVVGVGLLAVCTTILFEAIAHVSGAWYSVGEGYFRLFGLMPLEVFVIAFAQFLYVVFLHEFFVDDKRLHHVRTDGRKKRLAWFVIGLAVLGGVQAFIFSDVVLPYTYSLILVLLVAVLSVAVILSHRSPHKIVHKALHAVLLALPFMLLYEVVALYNVYTVYANASEYLFTFTLFGELVPIEKLLQVTLMSFWIVAVYELYFDDAR